MKGVGVDKTSAKGAMGTHCRIIIIYSSDDKVVYYYYYLAKLVCKHVYTYNGIKFKDYSKTNEQLLL